MVPAQSKPVNVSAIPQRSPFRYAGGKTWFVPYLRLWLRSKPVRPRVLVEPFAGGGIVSLTAVAESLVRRAVMVELDEQVASVWHTILNGDGAWLAKTVEGFDFHLDAVLDILHRSPATTREAAFRTLLRNRANWGGIIAPGAGLLKLGENGHGLRSRWYPSTIAKRIREIVDIKERIEFIRGDGIAVLKKHTRRTTAVFFIDPPYVAANKNRLYRHSQINHSELFQVASRLRGDFLMTYDTSEEAYTLADKHGFDTETIAMVNTHNSVLGELLIARDLSWLRRSADQ